MPTPQEIFAKNSRMRNIIFIFAFSLLVLLVSSYVLIGHKFLLTAPLMLAIFLSGLALKPPKYYLPFCVGAFLSFGLFQATLGFLMFGPVLPAFLDLVIGLIGFALIVSGVWQAIFGEWTLPRAKQIGLNIIVALGLLLIIFVIIKMEIHGMSTPAPVQNKTY